MKQESLEATDETVESKRESGIFADLAVRQSAELPRAEGRSIPPPPPPTRSSILPVARRPDSEPGMELEDSVAADALDADDHGSENEEDEEVDDFIDSEQTPAHVQAPSLIRPESAAASSARSVPPPPPRLSADGLPGTSFPSIPAGGRGGSIAPGTRPVSPMVASAAVAYPATQPAPRDLSGTFQKVEQPRTSYAAALQGPMAMPAAQVALDHAEPIYAPAPPAPPATKQVPYAMLIVGALIAGCFAWYMFAARAVPGVVQLTTAPADAAVLFDGVSIGSVSPFLKTGVAPGVKHMLEVKKPGFRTWAQEVEVQSGQTLIFTVALPTEAGDAPTVAAAAPVPAAPVAVAVEPAAVAPVAVQPAAVAPAAVEEVAPVAVKPAAAPAARAARAAPAPKAGAAAPSARRASPATANAATGTLRVSARPWAVVTIDGKVIGNTPQMNLTLPEGSHRVQLNNPEFNVEKVVTVTIAAGKTETLIVNLL